VGGLEEVLDIPDDPLEPSFFISLPRITRMDGKVIMPGEVQELRVEGDFWRPLEYHIFEVVIPMPMGNPFDFLEGSNVSSRKNSRKGRG
jgi:hypothetical protein